MDSYSRAKWLKIGVIAFGMLAGAGAVTLAALLRQPQGVIAEGVSFAGMDWSSKSIVAARAQLEAWSKERAGETLTLALPPEARSSRQWTPRRAELGVSVDIEATLADAEAVGGRQGAFERLIGWFGGHKRVDIAPRWKIDARRMCSYLRRKIAPVARQPERNARFIPLKQGFRIEPERPGAALDEEAAFVSLSSRATSVSREPFLLPMKITAPRITRDDFKDVDGEVSRFYTYYSERGNRRRNIELACRRINGTVLKPGGIFSYNRTVGPRDEDAGFKIAPVIIRGRMRPGMGGGICQTSSTLYNAVLLADLKIVRRGPHAFPVHYLPAGRDATVVYDSKDFRFQNNTGGTIVIVADGTGGRVLMRIFGKRVPGRTIRVERTGISSWGPGVVTVQDPSLPQGKRVVVERGHAGHRVTVWRIVSINGKQIKREMLSRDYYQAFPRIVAVGTKPIAPPAAPSSPPPALPEGPSTSAVPTPSRSAVSH